MNVEMAQNYDAQGKVGEANGEKVKKKGMRRVGGGGGGGSGGELEDVKGLTKREWPEREKARQPRADAAAHGPLVTIKCTDHQPPTWAPGHPDTHTPAASFLLENLP